MINPFKNLGQYGYGYGDWTFYHTNHLGIDRNTNFQDLPAPEKSKILAVLHSNEVGNAIVFQPVGRKIAIRWCHNSKIYVKAGDIVEEGQIIVRSGNTGLVRPKPTPQNPTAGRHTHEDHWPNGVITLKFSDTANPDDYYNQLINNHMRLPTLCFRGEATVYLVAGMSLFPFSSKEAFLHAGGDFGQVPTLDPAEKAKYDIRMESPIIKNG